MANKINKKKLNDWKSKNWGQLQKDTYRIKQGLNDYGWEPSSSRQIGKNVVVQNYHYNQDKEIAAKKYIIAGTKGIARTHTIGPKSSYNKDYFYEKDTSNNKPIKMNVKGHKVVVDEQPIVHFKDSKQRARSQGIYSRYKESPWLKN